MLFLEKSGVKLLIPTWSLPTASGLALLAYIGTATHSAKNLRENTQRKIIFLAGVLAHAFNTGTQ